MLRQLPVDEGAKGAGQEITEEPPGERPELVSCRVDTKRLLQVVNRAAEEARAVLSCRLGEGAAERERSQLSEVSGRRLPREFSAYAVRHL